MLKIRKIWGRFYANSSCKLKLFKKEMAIFFKLKICIPYGLAITRFRIYTTEVYVCRHSKRQTRIVTAALLVMSKHRKRSKSSPSRTHKLW